MVMKTYRDIMESGENLSWCKPMTLTYREREATVAVNEGDVVGLLLDGKDVRKHDLFNRLVEYLGIKGASSISDLFNYTWDNDEVDSAEMGCSDCPWFKTCEAMDEQYGDAE
jgi:hypothetical protein